LYFNGAAILSEKGKNVFLDISLVFDDLIHDKRRKSLENPSERREKELTHER
jgi:hypothetical protein